MKTGCSFQHTFHTDGEGVSDFVFRFLESMRFRSPPRCASPLLSEQRRGTKVMRLLGARGEETSEP